MSTFSVPVIDMVPVLKFLLLSIIASTNKNVIICAPAIRLNTTHQLPQLWIKEKLPNPAEYLRDRFPQSDALLHASDGLDYCRRPADCVPFNATCMGVKLSYSMTTNQLVGKLSQDKIQEHLDNWRSLRQVPKCWAVIQPLLCALYMPRCDGGLVHLPSQEMCKVAQGPCRLISKDERWQSLFNCEHVDTFPPKCKNDVREFKFNTSATCPKPLVPTDNAAAFYEGVEGCGIPCQDPLLTADEHEQIHTLVAASGFICFIFNLFTIITFVIDWRSASKYPALIVFYINLCFCVACVGWLAQFFPGTREDIICRRDRTLRVGEPSAGENLSCVAIFVLVYYFLMAAAVWFIMLTYAWHISFQAVGKIQERLDKKGAYFHLISWSLPLILTITTMATGYIDGSSVSGICFVGYINQSSRIALLLAPVAMTLLVGGYFLSRGLLTLIRLRISSREIVSAHARAKLHETLMRMGVFSLIIFIFILTTFVCHIYEFRRRDQWQRSFHDYIRCIVRNTESCKIESRPSVMMVQLHLLAMFGTGTIMSSWVWTSSTFHTWQRFIRRHMNNEVEEPVRLKKHKVIAQAFAKRKTFNNDGRMSISYHSTHEDPVGLNLDVNSIASRDLSSTWAAALPKLMTRRGALIGVTGSLSSHRRNSMDSEISLSIRRVSIESQRHSFDSQVSVQISEVKATRKMTSTPVPRGTYRRSKTFCTRRKRKEYSRCRVAPPVSRHGSTTSQESQLATEVITALMTGASSIHALVPHLMKRREANAGLETGEPIPLLSLQGSCKDKSEKDQEEEEAEEEEEEEDEDIKFYDTEDSVDQTTSAYVQSVPQEPTLSCVVDNMLSSGIDMKDSCTQTSLENLKSSINPTKSTQVSPIAVRRSYLDAGGLNYSCNALRLVWELAEKGGMPPRSSRQKHVIRSKSAVPAMCD